MIAPSCVDSDGAAFGGEAYRGAVSKGGAEGKAPAALATWSRAALAEEGPLPARLDASRHAPRAEEALPVRMAQDEEFEGIAIPHRTDGLAACPL